jgi:predicted nucleotidyltransferase
VNPSLKNKLDKAAALSKPGERIAQIGAVIAEAMRTIGRNPVLVGGAAVEFYTQGGYSTSDLDFVSDSGSDVIETMKALGFEKLGKDFVDRTRGIYVEFPSGSLGPGEKWNEIDVEGVALRIISCEDLIADRLCAYKFWKSAIDGVNTLLLMEMNVLDENRLLLAAKREGVQDALRAVNDVRETVVRKKLSASEATRLIEEKMRSL